MHDALLRNLAIRALLDAGYPVRDVARLNRADLAAVRERLTPSCYVLVLGYLASRRDPDPALFLSQRRQRISPRMIYALLDDERTAA